MNNEFKNWEQRFEQELKKRHSLKNLVQSFEQELKKRYSPFITISITGENGLTIDFITRLVEQESGIPITELRNIRRGNQKTCDARQVAMYCSFKYAQKTYAQIGRFFYKDHSTVIHGVRTIKNRINTSDQAVMPLLSAIIHHIKTAQNEFAIQNQ